MRAIEALRLTLSLDLTPVEKLTLMAVIHSVSWDTWKGQASIMQLAGMSGTSEKGVRRALEVLTDLKLIGRERSVSRYGEVSATISVNVELLKPSESEAEKHNEIAVGHVDRTLGHVDRTLGHVDRTLGHVDRSDGHVDRTPGHVVHREGQHDQAYILSSSVLISAPSVDNSVERPVETSVDGSAADAAREPEPEAEVAPSWRTLPPKTNGWLFSQAYFNIVKNDLGHDHNGIAAITNAIAAARVLPDRVDVQAFLASHPHLTH